MNSTTVFVLLFLIFLGCKEESAYVLENVQLINIETGEIGTNHILIRANRIESITKETIKGYRKIDLQGKYIMPSLLDMHVHLHADKSKLNNYFKQGVLGLRDLGAFNTAEVDSLVKWKANLRNNPSLKQPDIVFAGMINNDTTCYHGHRHIATYEDLKESCRYLNEIGSSFYKIHNCFPSELLPQLDSLAEVHDFGFGGHIPEGMDPLQFVKQYNNINSIEHVSVLLRALSSRTKKALNMMEAVKLLDGVYLDSLAVEMKEKEIAFTPNLLSEVAFITSYPEEQRHLGEALLERLRKYVKRISDHGVTILAGTDNGLESDEETSLYQELELLSEAGLSHLQVLQAATLHSDMALGQSPNLISKNSEANFIILNENPMENLSTLKSVFGIVYRGNYLRMNNLL